MDIEEARKGHEPLPHELPAEYSTFEEMATDAESPPEKAMGVMIQRISVAANYYGILVSRVFVTTGPSSVVCETFYQTASCPASEAELERLARLREKIDEWSHKRSIEYLESLKT